MKGNLVSEESVDNIKKAFDEIISEEDPSMFKIMMRLPNLLMIAVICLCIVIHFQLNKVMNKNRIE